MLAKYGGLFAPGRRPGSAHNREADQIKTIFAPVSELNWVDVAYV